MRLRSDRSRGRLVLPKWIESYYKFTREKMTDICCVGSGVKYHSLSYWSVVMTSPVEFSTDKFCAKQVRKVLKNGITNQGKKDFYKSNLVNDCYQTQELLAAFFLQHSMFVSRPLHRNQDKQVNKTERN